MIKLIAATAALLMATPTAASADISDTDIYARPTVSYSVVDISSWQDTNVGQRWVACHAGSDNITCGYNVTQTASRNIELSLGLSRDKTAASLGISSSYSETLSKTFTTTLRRGETLAVYPYGTYKRYRIRKVVAPKGGITYSGWLTAFNPEGITCRVE